MSEESGFRSTDGMSPKGGARWHVRLMRSALAPNPGVFPMEQRTPSAEAHDPPMKCVLAPRIGIPWTRRMDSAAPYCLCLVISAQSTPASASPPKSPISPLRPSKFVVKSRKSAILAPSRNHPISRPPILRTKTVRPTSIRHLNDRSN